MTIYISRGQVYLRVRYRDYFTDGKHLYYYETLNDRYNEVSKPYHETKQFYLKVLTDELKSGIVISNKVWE